MDEPARMPAVYLGHGAPPLVDDQLWVSQLQGWAKEMPKPKQILVVSAHWESAPLTLGATDGKTPLTYDFYGFPQRFYDMTYRSPGAPELAANVKAMMPDTEPVAEAPDYGMDHGAFVPLLVMYPEADIPVLQISMPDLDPEHLFSIGQRLRPLRDEGVLIMGSGFMTHGFDLWAAESLDQGAVDRLMDFRKAPGMPYAHPTVEHFAPLFVTLGAASDPESSPETEIDGFFLGLAKRSFQMA
jgi:4,5-DOPA dioxygenase extradiol